MPTYSDWGLYIPAVNRPDAFIGEELFQNLTANLPEDIIAYPDCIALETTYEQVSKTLNIYIEPNSVPLNTEESVPLNLLHRMGKLKKLNLFKNLFR